MSEDAHEIAQRIVREVLEAHEAREAEAEVARSAPTAGADAPAAVEIDLRDASAALTADATAAVLDDSVARQTARRIVAEVLEAHAAAERDTDEGLPVAAEGESAGPASATPVLHPVTGRPAVLPSMPEEPDVDGPADVADDAAAIARRIVASVLNQRPKADDGPPPLPEHVRRPAAVEPTHAPVSEDHEPVVEDDVPVPAAADPVIVDDAPVAEELDPGAEEVDPTAEASDADSTVQIAPVVVRGSHRLVRSEPAAEPVQFDASEPEPEPEPAPFLEPEPEPDPAPEATAVLAADDPAADEGAADDPAADDPAGADATMRVPIATLERPVVHDTAAEPTMSLPSAEPPRRTGRWLIASILGAVALAVLLPLAVEALRTLVSLS